MSPSTEQPGQPGQFGAALRTVSRRAPQAFAQSPAARSVDNQSEPPASERTGPQQAERLGVLLDTATQAPDWIQPLLQRASAGPLPKWVRELLTERTASLDTSDLPHRESAVLILLADCADGSGPDLLLTRRAATLRTHAGHPAFPGGALDPGEDVVQAALREGQEETGLDPLTVLPLLLLPTLSLPVSNYRVTPVVAYWTTPGPVAPVDIAETAAVARVPIADLVNPQNRINLRHPSGFVGAAFDVAGMRVWGFTAALVDMLLELAGWAVPWDRRRVVDMAVEPDRSLTGDDSAVARPEAGSL